MSLALKLAESCELPETLLRIGIRQRVKNKLNIESKRSYQSAFEVMNHLRGEISTASEEANEQHYELPADFFNLVLGEHNKYSACYFKLGVTDLTEAERDSIEQVIERADIQNNQQILELGCGWGSFSLYAAAKFPESSFTAVSNSNGQRNFIENQCKERGIENLKVITCDINKLKFSEKFDRIVSVEMFEHLRNHSELFKRISSWMNDGASMFVHIFCHNQYTYCFNSEQEDEWMAKFFFTGGLMPSKKLFHEYDEDLRIAKDWFVSGQHYEKTANAWAENLKANRKEVLKIFDETYGPDKSKLWFRRWLMFFLACAELFGYKEGTEWHVNHYLFEKA